MKTSIKIGLNPTESLASSRTNEWPQVSLKQICVHSAFGPRFSGELYAPEGNVATLRTTDISEDGRIDYTTMPLASLDLSKVRQHLLKEDDLVITRSGRVGTAAVFNSFRLPVLPGAFLIRFRLNREIAEPEFYRYYFNSPEGQALITSLATGSVQQNLNITSLHGLIIPAPPLAEQQAITRVLGTLDDKIDLNNRMNKTLEAIAQAIFKHWFIDFEFPNEEGKPYKSSGREMVDSGLGEIPIEWRVGNIGEIAQNPRRGVLPNEVEASTPYIGLEHMPRRSIALAQWEDACATISNKFQFQKREFLFGKLRPYFHKVGVAPVSGVCSTDILVVSPKKLEWYGLLLGHLSSDDFVNYSDATSTGTKMPRTSWEDMARYEIAIPPEKIAHAFNEKLLALSEKILSNVLQTRALVGIRDSLLPKLMSGKIRVPN